MVKVKNQDSQVEEGLKEMRDFHQEYQEKGKGSDAVRSYLEKSFKDEALLRRFLIGRKYRPKYAWETLRRYAEVRLEKYPEMFPEAIQSNKILYHENNQPIFGMLKGKDKEGRRIVYFESGWNTDKCSMEELSILFVQTAEKALLDEDGLNNGFIFIHESSKMGLAHAKQYTLGAMLRWINIYWNAFPIKLKGIYFVNVPYIFMYLHAMIKPFLPKKFKDRLLVTTSSRGFQDLHERVSIEILPKFLGGNLETDEASDLHFIDY